MKYLGIDFGTVWTKAAIYDTEKKGEVVLVKMDDGVAANTDFELYGGEYACPTAVFFDKESGTYCVGKKAVRSRNLDPINYHDKFKPFLSGNDANNWKKYVFEVLKYVIQQAFATSKNNDFSKIIITVPSSTIKNDERWKIMSSAAKDAYSAIRMESGVNKDSNLVNKTPGNWLSGIKSAVESIAKRINALSGISVSVIKEPEAAAYSLINDTVGLKNGDRFLVYDFGGGTFDPALIQFINGTLRVVGEWDTSIPRGKKIGGIYIDDKIRADILQKDKQQEDPYFQDIVDALSSIPMDEYNRPILKDDDTKRKYRNAIRDVDLLSQLPIRAKHHLSNIESNQFHEKKLGLYDYRLNKDEFEDLIDSLIDDTIQCCDTLMSDHGWSWTDLKSVFLVGGSSVIPFVRTKLERKKTMEKAMFSIPDTKDYDYLHAVARGAALYETLKPSAKQRLEFGKNSLLNKEYDEAEFQFKEGGHFYWLGLMEYDGLGRKKSYRKAYEVFSNHESDSLSCFMAAMMLFKGEGVKKDDAKALELIDKIAKEPALQKANMIKSVINGTASDSTINEVYSADFYKF